jgi:putative transposase
VSLRKEFVLKALSKEAPIAELCRAFGISRKTAYKWIDRFKKHGFDSLVDESRRPHTSPVEVSAETTLEIIRLRKEHPTWGARKLLRLLARSAMPGSALPSERTIRRVLERADLIRRRRRYRKPSYGATPRAPRYVVEQSNDLWTADFKGWWRTKDGQRCDPLTVRDAYSRMVLAVRVLDRTNTDEVRRVFEELFERHGLPKAIQTDNGPPFVSMRALCGLTRLSAWWVSLGLELVRSRPGCPQDNGAHERMHGDMRIEIEAHAADSPEAQQAACDEWRVEFNHVRPHEALDYRTPAEVYRASSRRPSHVIAGGFPDGCDLRLVAKQGQVQYFDKRVYISLALAGHHVGLLPVGAMVQVWFHDLLVGAYDPSLPDRDLTAQAVVPEETAPNAPPPSSPTDEKLNGSG